MFHRQDQNQKKVRRHPITFLSPFSIYLYDCISLSLSTKYVPDHERVNACTSHNLVWSTSLKLLLLLLFKGKFC